VCLIAFAWRASTRFPLLLAANRDEQHARPTAAADWWDEDCRVLGGRDLVAGGSWLAIDRRGRLAAVTNFSEPPGGPWPRSRGALVRDFLRERISGAEFVAALPSEAMHYGAFNLLLLDEDAHYASNRRPAVRLAPGIHALSNSALHSRWPKVRRGRAGLRAALDTADPVAAAFDLLAEGRPLEPVLNSDRVAPANVRRAQLFVPGRDYGTRCSTVVAIDTHGHVLFAEKRFDDRGSELGRSELRFALAPDALARLSGVGARDPS
jgi:uncharacterized protein with NRDE domain